MTTTIKTDKKAHILQVAEKLFANNGFEGTSVRDICTEAAVNVAMVNYYFGNKEGLFEKLVEQKAGFLKGQLEKIVDNTQLTHIQKIDLVIDGYVPRLFEQRNFHNTIMREMSMHQREGLHKSMAEIFMRNMRIIEAIIKSGIKKREFKKVDVEMTVGTILGVINVIIQSPTICEQMMNEAVDGDLYENEKFKQRLAKHLKQLMRNHLMNN
jgi:AcrR family transcriptional regulator